MAAPRITSKAKSVAAAEPVVEVKDYRGMRVVNRMGSVAIYQNERCLGRLSWLRDCDLSGKNDLIKIALAAHIEKYKSSEAFTLTYNATGSDEWHFSRP